MSALPVSSQALLLKTTPCVYSFLPCGGSAKQDANFFLAPKSVPSSKASSSRLRSAKSRATVSSDDDDTEEPLSVSTRQVPSSSKGKGKASLADQRERQLRESETTIRANALQLLAQAEALRVLREAEFGPK